MNKLLLCAAATLALCLPALANEPTPEMKAQTEKPMTMNATGNAKKEVAFPHSAHVKVECGYCHHKEVEGNAYVSCATTGCHDNMDKKDKSEHSYYQMIHNKKAEKSCMGCHAKAAETNPELKERFKGCAPCHKKD